jgi:tripartite-type tricarboxylate transporter receptor subunit TctC
MPTPEGYTLVMGAFGTHALTPALYDNIGYDPEKDFESIVPTVLIPMAISVHPEVKARNLSELIALMRAQPDKIDVALPSVTAQLVFEMLKRRGVPMYGIKYKGSGEAMAAVMGNQVPMLIDTVAASRGQLGKIRPLAVTSGQRMSALPDLPSVSEQGLARFNVVAWNVLMAPRGIPAAVRDRLAEEMRKILVLPETAKVMNDLGFEPAPPRTHEQLVAWLHNERVVSADVFAALCLAGTPELYGDVAFESMHESLRLAADELEAAARQLGI